jgi:hypothetical protein
MLLARNSDDDLSRETSAIENGYQGEISKADTIAILVDEGPAPGINGVISASVIGLTAEGFRGKFASMVAHERGI